MQTHEQDIPIYACASVCIFILYAVIYLFLKNLLTTHRNAQMRSSEAVSYDTIILQ